LSVHAIHSNIGRYGEGDAIGTVDVCINNGRQPFCRNSISKRFSKKCLNFQEHHTAKKAFLFNKTNLTLFIWSGNVQLCSHASSVCFFAESLFSERARQVEPCFNKCPQPFKASLPDGENATFGADMESR
jgi:hypothetical protein